MKELQITIKSPQKKDFESAIKYVLYQISLGVKDDIVEYISEGEGVLKIEFKLFED